MNFLFLIGAPKCGTSSFFNHLVAHPSLLGTEPKETYALLEATHPLRDLQTLPGLDALVAECEARLVRLGTSAGDLECPTFVEATTHNLYSARAREALAELGDAARAVALLRQPSRRILSSFRYTQQNLARIPQHYTFAEYVDALLAGDGEKIRRVVRHPASAEILANELELSDYAQHLRRWFAAVGGSRVRVIIAEDYFAAPREHVDRLLRWLELDPSAMVHATLPERKNPTRRVGLPLVQRVARSLNRYAPRGPLMRSVKARYFRMQEIFSRQSHEDYGPSLAKLDAYFEPHMAELGALLERSLEVWGATRPPQTAPKVRDTSATSLLTGLAK